MNPMIEIRNRPLVHYLVCLFSSVINGNEITQIRSRGSLIGKAIDLINLIDRNLNSFFDVNYKNIKEELYGKYKTSVIDIELKTRKNLTLASMNRSNNEYIENNCNESILNIFELELLIILLKTLNIKTISVSPKEIDQGGTIKPVKVNICDIDLFDQSITIDEDLIKNQKLESEDYHTHPAQCSPQNKNFDDKQSKDKTQKSISKIYVALANPLVRAGLLKTDLSKQSHIISKWDDIIFGLDTNLFYICALSSFVLDSFLNIPSDDFIDTPDWLTLVASKVSIVEIEHQTDIDIKKDNKGPDIKIWEKNEANRALQEILLINRSKDLQGVSLFLTGTVPPEIDLDKKTNTMRDFITREHFRAFLKSLDFYKGSFLLTSDYNNASLGEAEGLNTFYIKKPELTKSKYCFNCGDTTFSQLLYELSVSFQPLIIKGDGFAFEILCNWKGKSIQDWQNWLVKIKWEKDDDQNKKNNDLKKQFFSILKDEIINKMIQEFEMIRNHYLIPVEKKE